MKNIGRIVIRLGVAVVASGSLCSSLAAMPTVDFQVVSLRGVPQFREPVYLAIRTRAEWLTFTKMHGEEPPQTPTVPGQVLTPIPQPPVSEVDFDRYTLLVIGIGGRTGYSVSIERIVEIGEEIQVRFDVLRPGRDCAVAQVYGHPYVTVLIPQTDKPVRFNEVAADIDCANRKSSLEMRELIGNE
jgi:hypothetical protein